MPHDARPMGAAPAAALAPPADAFSFVDAGRTYTCRVETARAGAWWWFAVSTEAHQRHAPFRAEAGDTEDGVRARIVAYYEERLARRAAPPAGGPWHARRAARPEGGAAAPPGPAAG